MASKKTKKKKASGMASRGFGKKDIDREFSRAENYILKGQWRSAYDLLTTLSEQYPKKRDVWIALSDACMELGDFRKMQTVREHIVELDPDNANSLYSLGFAYLENNHLLMALDTFRRALDIQPEHVWTETVQEVLPSLEEAADEARGHYAADDEDWWELALLHEKGQTSIEAGEYDRAYEAEMAVLQKQPNHIPAQNNLSLIAWLQGDVEQAIATAKTVLEHTPNNIHALSNLVHFCVVSGDEDAAANYAKKLKSTQKEDAWNGWAKKAEGLSYLGDDEGVLEVYERWVAEESEESSIDPLFAHLAAVALARCDRLPEARKRWMMAARSASSIQSIAQKNLKDANLPISERHGAWPFSLNDWLLPKANEEFQQILETYDRTQSARKMENAMRAFFEQNAEFIQLVPRILERGGPEGQNFLLVSAENMNKPELLEAIKVFALSKNGTDRMRTQAAAIAAEAGLLAKGEKMTVWSGGEWREVQQLSYEIYQEPEQGKHSPKVEKLLAKAVRLMHEQTDESIREAETILKEALALEPDAPDVRFNLATAYMRVGKTLQGEALIQEVHKQCPDYLFARVALAKFNVRSRNFKAAEALLEPLQHQDRFHASEFDALMDVRIDLQIAQKHYGAAEGWLNLWAQEAPEHPAVMKWRSRLELAQGFDL